MPSREFLLEPSLRRCCWYGLASLPVLLGLMPLIAIRVQGRDPWEVLGVVVMVAIFGSLFVLPLAWRLRLGDQGITRQVFCWQSTWLWEAFEAGLIEKRLDGKLVHHGVPWWRWFHRCLTPGHLKKSDRDQLIAAINDHYQVPPLPTLPETLSLKMGFKRYSLDTNGIHGTAFSHTWSEVVTVYVGRLEEKRRDFIKLELQLPSEFLDFRVINGNTTWRGASPEELVEFLRQQLPAEKFYERTTGQPFSSRLQAERHLATAEKNAREFAYIAKGYPLLLLAFVAWEALDGNLLKGIALGLLGLIPCGPLLWWMHRANQQHVKQCRELLKGNWREQSPPKMRL